MDHFNYHSDGRLLVEDTAIEDIIKKYENDDVVIATLGAGPISKNIRRIVDEKL